MAKHIVWISAVNTSPKHEQRCLDAEQHVDSCRKQKKTEEEISRVAKLAE